MSTPALISVIIPVYNGETTLDRAIKSVVNQSYSNLELIIVNDGSTDNTAQIVKSVVDSRIKYIELGVNKGRSFARNAGVKASKGKYIAFLDADDEWLSGKLEAQLNYLISKSDPNFQATISNYTIQKKLNKKEMKILESETMFIDLLMGDISLGSGSTLLIKKNVFNEIGYYNENYNRNEDVDFMLRYLKLYKLAVTPDCLVIVHGHNSTKSAQYLLDAKVGFLSFFKSEIEKLPRSVSSEVYAKQWLEVARVYSIEGDVTNTSRFILKSLRHKIFFSNIYILILYRLVRSSLKRLINQKQ